MKTKHTPGPWSLEYDYSLVMPHKRGNQIIIGGTIGPTGASQEERKANMKLIAAAPELLDYLTAIKSVCEFQGVNAESRIRSILICAGQAIQKATQP